jgi:hypothetical protein
MSAQRVVVAGSLAQAHGRGGHAWALLNYLIGFQLLGWRVYFVDRLVSEEDRDVQLHYLAELMNGFGFEDSYAVLDAHGDCVVGAKAMLRDVFDDCDLLLDISGFLEDEDLRSRPKVRAFLDIDPGFWQMWKALGLHDALGSHDLYATVGENIGGEDCAIPAGGIEWITTRPPIALDHWPQAPPSPDASISTVASWRGPFAPIEFEGERFGLRAHEFRRFAGLPGTTEEKFEIALDIDAADAGDREMLEQGGWVLSSPAEVAGDPWRYQRFVQESKAEIGIAKEMYVKSRSGWFSDRSVAYLASGRPALVQDTGLSTEYRGGEGLLLFENPDQAERKIAELKSEYVAHCHAARSTAERLFDSAIVLPQLIRDFGLTP